MLASILDVSDEAKPAHPFRGTARPVAGVEVVQQKEKRRLRNASPVYNFEAAAGGLQLVLRSPPCRASHGACAAAVRGRRVEITGGPVAPTLTCASISRRVSNDALDQVREHIGGSYGAKYLPEKPNFFKSKKDAQDAHEAIRPTEVMRTPESVKPYLDESMWRLYQMIWQRFVASQMVPAVFDQTSIDIGAADYTFRASGSVIKFDGYLTVYQIVKVE